jgi:hypothetical protein
MYCRKVAVNVQIINRVMKNVGCERGIWPRRSPNGPKWLGQGMTYDKEGQTNSRITAGCNTSLRLKGNNWHDIIMVSQKYITTSSTLAFKWQTLSLSSLGCAASWDMISSISKTNSVFLTSDC